VELESPPVVPVDVPMWFPACVPPYPVPVVVVPAVPVWLAAPIFLEPSISESTLGSILLAKFDYEHLVNKCQKRNSSSTPSRKTLKLV
jgi:hypothetical protein